MSPYCWRGAILSSLYGIQSCWRSRELFSTDCTSHLFATSVDRFSAWTQGGLSSVTVRLHWDVYGLRRRVYRMCFPFPTYNKNANIRITLRTRLQHSWRNDIQLPWEIGCCPLFVVLVVCVDKVCLKSLVPKCMYPACKLKVWRTCSEFVYSDFTVGGCYSIQMFSLIITTVKFHSVS